jgi:hypothetical protein
MQLKNVTKASVILVEGKFCLELPDEAIIQMELSASDTFDFSLDKNNLKLWKSPKKGVPQEVYDELSEMYAGNEQVISSWLCTPRIHFEGKAAIDLLDTPDDIKAVKEFIWQLKTGELS